MVQITSALERVKKDGSQFCVLEISGGAELVLSQTTQRYYATVRRCTIPFTGTMDVAKMLIGQKIDGEIVRTIVEPYQFTNPRSGEVITLQHSYSFRPN
jgi:ubiquinone/menaquinone biosynthesis C-methylase UbiE